MQRLDTLPRAFGYVALTTATMLQAAAFWAELRQQGRPTADATALDGDVILAAQAALLRGAGVATTSVGHLARLVPADVWQHIIG